MRPARAQILYEYFENDTLRIHATNTQDFNVPNYAEMMNSLFQ